LIAVVIFTLRLRPVEADRKIHNNRDAGELKAVAILF